MIERTSLHIGPEPKLKFAAGAAMSKTEYGQTIRSIEIRRVHRSVEKHIIVRIQEVLRKSGNTVKKMFKQWRVETGKTLRWQNLLVIHNLHLRIRCVEPFRNLVICDNKNPTYPRRIHLYGPQAIFQFVIIGISTLTVFIRIIISFSDDGISLGLPLGVVAVNP